MDQTTAKLDAPWRAPDTLSGKYLTFVLEGETFGITILKVREIIGAVTITSVPQAPDYVRGVINLRGKVIPMMDLRRRFGLSDRAPHLGTCTVVVEAKSGERTFEMGVIVDSVNEVLEFQDSDLEPPLVLGGGFDNSFMLGIAKSPDKVTVLLDIERALGDDEISAIGSQVKRKTQHTSEPGKGFQAC